MSDKSLRFFCYDAAGNGFDEFDTEAEARDAAECALESCRDMAPEGWPEGTEHICWGMILGGVMETERRPSTPDDLGSENYAEYVDYGLERYTEVQAGDSFQARVAPWMQQCFGREIACDRIERNHRFLEEALELIQACGCTRDDAHALVDYVYGRPVGEPEQEVGGVTVTLAALCLANGIDMHRAGETELARVWTKIDAIRAKQATKPRGSALPAAAAPPPVQAA